MKKFLIALAVVLVLIVGAILVVPNFIDWNAHKGRILAAIEENTGRPAFIDGDIDFSILPTPALRVTELRVSNFDGAQTADMLRLKELQIRVSVAALLDRRLVVERLELIEPVIALEIAEDGRASWDIKAAESNETATPPAGDGEESAPLDISLANVTVRDGTVTFRDLKSGTAEQVEKLNMTVSAPSLSGPFDLTATAHARGIPLSVELKTGALKPQQPLTFGLKAILTEADASLTFNGRMHAPIPTGLLTGKLEVAGSNAGQLVALATGAAPPPGLAQAVSLDGTLMVSPDAIALNDTAIRLGALTGNGAVSVTLGDKVNADIAVSVSRLDLDALLKQIDGAAPAKTGNAATAGGESKNRPAPDANAGPLSLPTNVSATFDLSVDVVQYRGGVIREAGLRAALANGAITLDRATALLPGGSDFSVLGFISFAADGPRFDGEVAAASDNLRALLDWAGVDTAALPQDRLRGFSYASKIKATSTAVEVPDINVRLDASTMTGGLAVALRERPGFGLRLAIDQLNLDAYIPRQSRGPEQAPSGGKAVSNATAENRNAPPSPLAFLDTFDANIDAQIERLTVNKTALRKLHLDGLLVGGAFNVRKASVADFAGLGAELSGDVKELTGKPAVALRYSAVLNEPDKLFRFAGTTPPIPAAKLGNATLNGRIVGTLDTLTVKSDFAGAGTRIAVDGALRQAATTPSFDMGVAVNHPELSEFVRLLAPDFRPAAQKLGPLAAAFRIDGKPADFRMTKLDLAAGPLRVEGNAAIKTDGSRPFVRADLATNEILLDLFEAPQIQKSTATARGRAAVAAQGPSAAPAGDRWSQAPIDFSALQGVDADVTLRMAGLTRDRIRLTQPELEAALKDGRLEIRRFKAGVFGGTVTATGMLDAARKAPPAAIDVTASKLDLATISKTFDAPPRADGPLSATAKLTMAGNTEAALVSSLGGTAAVSGKVRILTTQKEDQAIGALGIASLLFGNKVKELRQAGSLSTELVQAFGRAPADLSGNFTVDRGIWRTRDTVLTGTGARALTAGAADLPRWLIDATTSIARSGQDAPTPYITVGMTGPLDDPNIKVGGDFLKSSGSTAPDNPVQQILPGILGKQSGGSGSDQGNVQPQDILRGLLKGLKK